MKRGAGIAGQIASLRYAVAGGVALLRGEPNTRIHLVVTLAVLTAAILLRIDRWEWCWLVLAIGLVWTAEAFNTAIEQAADAITTEPHPAVKTAKDVAAFAVLVIVITSSAIGVFVLGPHLW